MKKYRARLIILSVVLLLGACSVQPVAVAPGTLCRTDSFSVSDNFEGARRGVCTVVSGDRVELEIVRESELVTNPSPWYAFRIEPVHPGPAVVDLNYGTWPHRYVPKISRDGLNWTAIDAGAVTISEDAGRATITVEIENDPVWISAQELVLPSDYEDWLQSMSATETAQLAVLGESAQGRAISMLDSGGEADDIVLLVGRQHPPEVSGAIAMRSFLETVFSESDLATRYRERFRIIAVPLMNPDGVIAGNWRGNSTGADLNRDWGPFEQPETREVLELLDNLDREAKTVVAFIDFHSTQRNLFYTPATEKGSGVAEFVEAWFDRVRPRLGNYPFANEKRPTTDTPNGKNYMFERYGVPSLTYEVGDETNRAETVDAAHVFAEELMHLMLETPLPGNTQ